MSDRYLITPGRAFEQTLMSLNSQLEQIAKRIRWSSSTATDADDSDQTVTVVASSITWTTIATLTLDPGRWMLLGKATIVDTNGIGSLDGGALLRIRSTTTLDEKRFDVFFDSSVTHQSPMNCATEVNLVASTTITLDAALDAPTGTGPPDCVARYSRLTGAPA